MSVWPPTTEERCVVVVNAHLEESDLLGRLLMQLQVNTGRVVTYERLADLLHNPPPTGSGGLIVVATKDAPALVMQALLWLRDRYGRCMMLVIGDEGCGELELAARAGGANYMTRPVDREQWLVLLSQVFAPVIASAPREPAPRPRP